MGPITFLTLSLPKWFPWGMVSCNNQTINSQQIISQEKQELFYLSFVLTPEKNN